MGLGKTLQMLSFICHLVEKGIDRPILVVLPTSLIFNWKKEIEILPSLTAAVYHGTSRGDFADAYANHQVILTSYGLLVNDLEMMKELGVRICYSR